MVNLKNKKHLFFDLDDTLWDFEKNSSLILKEIFVQFELGLKLQTSFIDFYKEYNIEINDSTLMWAVQEPLKYTEIDNMPLLQYSSSDDADLHVGIVYLVDESNMTNKLPLHISPDRPYTHSQQVLHQQQQLLLL